MRSAENLSGKTVVITGATSGIGLASAHCLGQHGANIIGIGRDPRRCQQAAMDVQASAPNAQVRFLVADFSRLADVRAVAPQIRACLSDWQANCLDALVNNAGVVSPTFVRTEDGLELTAAVTHFAHFLLTHELLPELQAAPMGRVITVSSKSHYGMDIHLKWLNRPPVYVIFLAYKWAKLCNVLFTYEFNRRFGATAMRAFALDPGLVDTGIGQKSASGLISLAWAVRRRGGASPDVPADGILHLVANPALQETDQYYWLRSRQPKAPSRFGKNPRTAAELWELSERLCGIQGFGQPG